MAWARLHLPLRPGRWARDVRYASDKMTLRCCLLVLLLAPSASLCQTSITVPSGTPLPVQVDRELPMRAGEPLRGELMYPVYVGERLVLPAKTVVTGTVVSLKPDRTRRIHARLRADFTPFHIPAVRFDHVLLADGTSVPLATGTATDGAPIYRLVAPAPHKGGMVAQQLRVLEQAVKDRVAVVTGPNKAERLKQFFWSQMPYHPERIAKGTAWTVETAAALDVPVSASAAASGPAASGASPAANGEPEKTWVLQAYLNQAISSAASKTGETIRATVATPVLNADGSVAVPVGSVMTGSVTQARPARSFGRAGVLRFSFRELKLPGEDAMSVQAALTGADSASDGEMAMNSEGEVKPKPQDKVIVPLLLIALAARPLDRDGGRDNHMLGKDAVASNALGMIGLIVGTAAQRPNLAAGIGYYGAAISIYERIFRTGKEVRFGRDTRVVIQTTARRAPAIRPAGR